MQSIVLVSSKTGNTYKIARYVRRAFGPGCVLARTEDPLDLNPYEVVLVGFWLDSGHVDEPAMQVLRTLTGKKVGIFATLGGNPGSPEAHKVMQSAVNALLEGDRGNVLLGTFWSQGRISAEVLTKMHQMFPHLKDDPKHLARVEQAKSHPDDRDKLKALLTAETWRNKVLKMNQK